jgi:hypothetical protein
MRDKNMELLFSAINKAPAEAVAPLLSVAFEISDIPEKERILDQVRKATGMSDQDDDLTTDQRKERQQMLDAKQRIMAEEAQEAQKVSATLKDEKERATIRKTMQEGEAKIIEANAQKQKVNQEGFIKGQELARGLDDTARRENVGQKN